MGLFALKRYAKEGSDAKHHVSLVSHDDWSVIANADLPFKKDEAVYGSSCRGLVYFMGKNGQIVVCNLSTRKWKIFPLPDYFSTSSMVVMDSCGLGYDPKSGDYKLFRNIIHYYNEDICEGDEVVGCRYLGYKDYTQVYSFKSCSWKAIRTPDAAIMFPCAVYVSGSCYWTACGLEDDPRNHILAFDIATECFDHIFFPQTSIGQYAWRKVVEYRGLLAALIYDGPNAIDCASPSPLHINLFVRRENTWQLLFDFKLENVEKPLGFGESCDGSILFLEGKHNIQNRIQTNELMVYNFHSKELKKLGIYDYQSHMIPISFDIKKYRPRGSTPMAFVDNIVPLSENVEEMKTGIDLMKNRPRMMAKSGRKKKKKKKMVFELLKVSSRSKRRRH
ncbi:hypothetical protein OROGR_018237 [Orobanche gracilis]